MALVFIGWIFIIAACIGFTWAGVEVAHGHYYKPGDDIGYNMGLIGGLMMLVMLTYPMRKHLAFMRSWGALKYWFSLHMMLGIIGPALVMFHSTFHVGSMNAAVAFTCMVVVAVSGVIGRFVYTRIHRGLYGSKLTLKELQEELSGSSDEVKSRLHGVPSVEGRLGAFRHYALEKEFAFPLNFWRFMILGICRRIVGWQCVIDLRRAKFADVREVKRLVTSFLDEVQRAAQFAAYDRIFSLWHVLHVPLVYMLAATAVFHVIAVHMY